MGYLMGAKIKTCRNKTVKASGDLVPVLTIVNMSKVIGTPNTCVEIIKLSVTDK
jgi:hypothetical protein